MRFDKLTDWLEWLEKQHSKTIDLGLDRVSLVAQRLGIIDFAANVITVAGTNGKGSFVASVAAILRAHGHRVATYTSPHLLTFNERIVLNGEAISDQMLMVAFDKVDQVLDDVSLTYFEFTTLAAFYIFKQQSFDEIILEIGLGGRLDAVNIIEPNYAVITSIGIDHQEYLGNNLNSIAYEKCGILRSNTPLICAEINPPEVLLEAINSHTSLCIGRDFEFSESGDNWSFTSKTLFPSYPEIKSNGLSIPSQAAAIAFVHHFLGADTHSDIVKNTLNSLTLAGRFQRFDDNEVTIILDVAHNEQAATMLHSRLAAFALPQGCKRFAVFNMLNDKDCSAIVKHLSNDFSAWFLGDINHSRASKISDIGSIIEANGNNKISYSKNIRQAYARARSLCQSGDQIIVFGSFFVVAEMQPKLSKQINSVINIE